MNTQYRKNLKAVAQACKDYTDKEIKKVYYDIGHNDITTDDHTDEATYRFTAPANAKLLMLQSIAGNSVKYSPSVASDSTTAYQKNVPTYTNLVGNATASINTLGGMSYKINQLVGNLKATFTTGGVTFTNNGDGSMTLNGTATEEIGSVSVGVDLTANITFPRRSHKVLVTCNNTLSGFYYGVSGYSINNSGAFFFNESNPTDWTNGIGCHIVAGTVFNNFKIIPQSFDLTADFGSGNEPTSVSDCATEYAKRGIDIYSYTPQQSAIRDTKPTSVVSKDSNNTTIDTLSINASIQALDGYGWGINDTCYNYVNFNTKKFIKVVGKYTFTGNETFNAYGSGYRFDGLVGLTANKYNSFISDINLPILATPTSIASGDSGMHLSNTGYLYLSVDVSQVIGKTIYYELATPIETDISEYLDGNEIEIEPNGTLSFESTYSAYVPSNISYNGVIKHALATAVKQEGANKLDYANRIENKTINDSGVMTDNSNYYVIDNVDLLPNTTYSWDATASGSIYQYDSSNNYLGKIHYTQGTSFTTLSNAKYFKFDSNKIYVNPMLNEGSTVLSYRPYKATITRLLPNSEAKYSWGITTGVRNVRTYCDDEGNAVNEGSLDVSKIILSEKNWLYESTYHFWQTRDISDMKLMANNSTTYTGLSENYESKTWNQVVLGATYSVASAYASNDKRIIINTNSNSVKPKGDLLYQIDTTSTETLDDFDYFFDCEEGDTFTLVNSENLQCYATYSFLIKEAKSNE